MTLEATAKKIVLRVDLCWFVPILDFATGKRFARNFVFTYVFNVL